MANTALEQLKKLDEQRSKLLEEATTEARKKADEAIADLNALGYNFTLVEDEPKRKLRSGTPRKKTEICSFCKFATDPSHDGRLKLHRDQDKKRPLTEKELADNGLKKR